jgi:hypothetical protein
VADINLTQADADVLLAMEKHKLEDTPYEYPSLGGGVRIPLQSPDKRELFFLDITRSQVVLTKGTYQNRARGVAILARLDSVALLTEILMTRRSPVRTCTSILSVGDDLTVRRVWGSMGDSAASRTVQRCWRFLAPAAREFMQFVNITVPPDVRRDLFT